jgi:hypothetical protein
MYMNFSEFKRQLGADPASQDPAFLRARQSSPEFIQAAAESDLFEHHLHCALALPAPQDLLHSLQEIGRLKTARPGSWRHYALAASLLLAVAAGGITWRMNTGPDTVAEYVENHYAYDGPALVARGEGQQAANVDEILHQFQVGLTPEMTDMVSVIKFCPTPAGTGAHMVLNTEHGPITVIFMPDTEVADGEMLDFDGMQAQLVDLAGGSAVVIGTLGQQVAGFHTLVQNSFIPLSAST